MKNVIIDFESFYSADVNVVDQGVVNYCRDTEAYIVSIEIDGEAAMCGTLKEIEEVCTNLAADPSVRPVAANSGFDQALWEKYWPAFKKPWHCILDQSVFHQMPRNLAGLAKVLLGQHVDKTLRDKMRGQRYEALPEAEQIKVQEYCLNDTVVEAECFRKMAPMSAFEERVALLTRMQNRRGVAIDTELVARDKTKIEQMRFEAFKSIPWHEDAKPLSYPALVKYCGVKNLPVPKSLAKTDEGCDDLMTDNPELSQVIGHMRRFRRANTILTKIEALKARISDAGILPLELLFCGAPHTRRWSCKGVNLQNLDKEPLIITPAVDDKPAVSVWSRNWIKPRPGKIFYIVDYAQIEPRCLNWLVGNIEMMEALRHGFSYYEAYLRAAKQEKRVGWSGTAGTLKKEVGVVKYTKVKNESLGCIAEGTLILTRSGYRPIESVTSSDLVWDGDKWVSHSGLLFQGVKPVISIRNESFTTDHEIYYSQFLSKPAGEILANQQTATMAWRPTPDGEWGDLRKLACSVFKITAKEGVFTSLLLLRRLQEKLLGFIRQFKNWKVHSLREMREGCIRPQSDTKGVGKTDRLFRQNIIRPVGRDKRPLHKPGMLELPALRGPGNTAIQRVSQPSCICKLLSRFTKLFRSTPN